MESMITQFELPSWSELIILSSNIDDIIYKAQNQTAEMLESSPSDIPPPTAEETHEFWRMILSAWREGHGKNLIVTRGAMAIISFTSSVIFIWMILRSSDGLKTTQHRLLIGLCIADVIYSSTQILFGHSGPKELDYVAWNAHGNLNYCLVNGSLRQFGLFLGTWYNASLCLFYLAVVKYKKSDDFVTKKIEPYLHGVPFIIALGHVVLRLSTEGLNPSVGGSCSEFVYNPPHCFDAEDGYRLEGFFDTPCGRGRSSKRLNEAIYFIIVFSPAIIMIASLALIYKSVREQEKKIAQYGIGSLRFRSTVCLPLPDEVSHTKKSFLSSLIVRPFKKRNQEQTTKKKMQFKSRTIMNKAVAYSCSWLMTWIFWIFYLVHNLIRESSRIPLTILYLFCIFMPLQGVYNLAIYMHPRIISAKRSKREQLTWWQAFVKAFWSHDKRSRKRGAMPSSQRNTASAKGNKSSAGFYSFVEKSSTIKAKASLSRYHESPSKNVRDVKKSLMDSLDEEEGEAPFLVPNVSSSPQSLSSLTSQHDSSIPDRDDDTLTKIRKGMINTIGKEHEGKKDQLFDDDNNAEERSITTPV